MGFVRELVRDVVHTRGFVGARETAATKSGVSKRKSEATAPVRKPATAATANRKSGGRRFHGAKNSRAGSVLMAFAAVAVCAGAVVYFLIANGGEDGAAGAGETNPPTADPPEAGQITPAYRCDLLRALLPRVLRDAVTRASA